MTAALVFLTFTMCLGPHQCREFNGGHFDSISSCVAASLPAIAIWLVKHPQYEFNGDCTCGPTPADESDEL